MDKQALIGQLIDQMGDCHRCDLCQHRRHIVFGRGNPQARLMLIGEGPGAEEDQQGFPFVGKAGQLLDKIIAAADLPQGDIYICNVVKCRPPGNRLPTPEETIACKPFLREQIRIIQPKIIVCLGSLASQIVLNDGAFRITRGRGVWVNRGRFPIMPTFHPAALLRDQSKKRPVWEDFLQVSAKYQRITNLDR